MPTGNQSRPPQSAASFKSGPFCQGPRSPSPSVDRLPIVGHPFASRLIAVFPRRIAYRSRTADRSQHAARYQTASHRRPSLRLRRLPRLIPNPQLNLFRGVMPGWTLLIYSYTAGFVRRVIGLKPPRLAALWVVSFRPGCDFPLFLDLAQSRPPATATKVASTSADTGPLKRAIRSLVCGVGLRGSKTQGDAR